jgi:predicted HD superfamily hydrolase involved in NAD metabolism
MSLFDVNDTQGLLRLVRESVSQKTAAHCECTAEFMVSFAAEAGITEQHARVAGLLHDLRKDMDHHALLHAAETYGIAPNDVQLRHPGLLHGPVAAELCRREFKLGDEGVLDAIYWHTTGRPGWNNLGLALYFADYAEPLRMFPEAVNARDMLARKGFWPALHYAADAKLEYIQTRKNMDPITTEFHEWLHERLPK